MNEIPQFIEINGHKIAVKAYNEHLGNTPIIFIHGVMGSYKFFEASLPKKFLEYHRFYSLSLPAHSPSIMSKDFNPDDVNENFFITYIQDSVDKLIGDNPYILVGHSTGGFIALIHACQRPKNLKGIISIAGFYEGDWGSLEGLMLKLANLGKWTKPIFNTNIRISFFAFIQRMSAFTLSYDKKAFRKSKRTNLMLKTIRPDTVRQKPDDLYFLFSKISTLDIKSALKNINVPTYLFIGSHDPIISASQSLILASEVPNAKLVVFDKVGHMMFMECESKFDAKFIDAMDNLLKQ